VERTKRDLITNKAKRLQRASVRNVKIFQRKTLTFAHTDNIIKPERRKEVTQWHIVAAQAVAINGSLHRPQSGRKTSTSGRRSAGAASGCNVPNGTMKGGEQMDFNESMNIFLKILAMLDKIYHAIVKEEEETEEEE
jgi:hypothetical protein